MFNAKSNKSGKNRKLDKDPGLSEVFSVKFPELIGLTA
jgi:hypothetical protein